MPTKLQEIEASRRYDKVAAVLMTATEPVGAAHIAAKTNIYIPVVNEILYEMAALRLIDACLCERGRKMSYNVYALAKNQNYARATVGRYLKRSTQIIFAAANREYRNEVNYR